MMASVLRLRGLIQQLASDVRFRMRALVFRSTLEQDLRDELVDHIARHSQKLVRQGLTPEEAQRRARVHIGGVEPAKEAIRQARGTTWIEQLWQDVRYAWRTLARQPVYALAAILSLALGIGANTAMFSAVDALLVRPLPVRDPERLVTFEMVLNDGYRYRNLSFGDYRAIEAAHDAFAAATATSWAESFNVQTAESAGAAKTGVTRISVVIGNYFNVLGLSASAGRLIDPTDDGDDMGAHPVVVISDAYWQRVFARSATVVGRRVSINGHPFTVIGVAPRRFDGDWVGWKTDLWIPSSMIFQVHPESERRPRINYQFKVIARLERGVSLARAQAAADLLYRRSLDEQRPGSGIAKNGRLEVLSAARGYSPQRESFERPLIILMGIVAAVLLIACANMANLQLARAVVRRREIGMRIALGAGRGRIVRQLMTESILLSLLGGALGIAVAAMGMRILSRLANSGPAGGIVTNSNPLSLDMSLRLDARVLGFAVLLSVITSVLFGLAPSIHASKVSLLSGLGVGGARASHSGRPIARAVLVVSQIAISLVLVVATGLFTRTLRNLQDQDLGFDRDHLLLVWTLPGHTGKPPAEIAALWPAVQERVAALPGVRSAAVSIEGLMSGGPTSGPLLSAMGRDPGDSVRVQVTSTVSPGYFATIGLRLLVGREFTRFDSDSAPKVAIVNRTLARRLFDSSSALNQRIVMRGSNSPLEIVGVVADTKSSPRNAVAPAIYYPPGQNINRLTRGMTVLVRAAGDPIALAASVRQALADIEPKLPILRIDTADEQLDDILFQERLVAILSLAFAALALVLSCVGIYGVVSYITARRTQEIGIRVALGAGYGSVVTSVLADSLRLAIAGVVIGALAAIAVTRMVAGLLYGVAPADPLTMIAGSALLFAVAAAAGFLPARRAARVSPLVALRTD